MKLRSFSHYMPIIAATTMLLTSSQCIIAAEQQQAQQEQQQVRINLSEIELQEIFRNPTLSYVYIGRELSNIADLIAEISKLDNNENSLLYGFKGHMERGFNIAQYDAVAQVLEYAELVLNQNRDKVEPEMAIDLTRGLNTVIEQVMNEQFNLDAELLSFIKDSVPMEDTDITRGCCHPSGLRLLIVKEKMDVIGRAKFYADVTFKEDVKFKDDVKFEDKVTFENNIIIQGTLSVADEVVSGDIFLADSTDLNHGNIIKAGAPFIHTFPGAISGNTFVGDSAGNFTMTGTDNSGFGAFALPVNTTGTDNTAVGFDALLLNTTGIQNTAVGSFAMVNNVTGSNNVTVGWNSFSSGDQNTIVGSDAGDDGSQNVAVGYQSLFSIGSDNNTAVGWQTMMNTTTGGNNIAIGSGAGVSLVSGSNNVYIAADAASAGESNVTRIANIFGTTTGSATTLAVLVDSTGQLGTFASTESVKHDINDMTDESASIFDLRPVTFVYNGDESETTQYGLVAEEVDKVLSGIVVHNENGAPFSVQYHVLPVLLLNEMKKQQVTIENMSTAITTLQTQVQQLLSN